MSAALRAIEPGLLMSRAWRPDLVPSSGPVWLIAAGKASRAMAAFAVEALGERLQGGLVVLPNPPDPTTPDLKVGPTFGLEVGPTSDHDGVRSTVGPTFRSGVPLDLFVGGHPLPTEASVTAATRARALACSTRPDETMLVLLSGGASALMALPAPGITLDDKRDTGQRLLAAGADIHAVNTVRKHLSAVKGGHLAACAAATTVTLAISDVVGDDPSVIGSGPTVPDATTYAEAVAVLDGCGGSGQFRRAVVVHLERGRDGRMPDTPKPGDARLARTAYRLIGTRRDAMTGAATEARARGYSVMVQEEPVIGEARHTARHIAAEFASRCQASRDPLCLITSGETTVHVNDSGSAGRGGRNQEFALAAAAALAAAGVPACCASVGTDGVDGPTDAAGAIADHLTTTRAKRLGLEPDHALTRHDSYSFFDALGDLIRTGPTGTNVGDLQVWLMPASPV